MNFPLCVGTSSVIYAIALLYIYMFFVIVHVCCFESTNNVWTILLLKLVCLELVLPFFVLMLKGVDVSPV